MFSTNHFNTDCRKKQEVFSKKIKKKGAFLVASAQGVQSVLLKKQTHFFTKKSIFVGLHKKQKKKTTDLCLKFVKNDEWFVQMRKNEEVVPKNIAFLRANRYNIYRRKPFFQKGEMLCKKSTFYPFCLWQCFSLSC